MLENFVHLIMLENFVFSLSYRVKTNATFGVACFPSDKIYYENYFVHLIMLENFVFSLSYRVKTNATFGVACFPSDKIYYEN
jgi:hypothetical protein